jgi:hypothetical protein
MGNGAKAQQKRDRNAKDDKKAGSQLKSVRFSSHASLFYTIPIQTRPYDPFNYIIPLSLLTKVCPERRSQEHYL